MRIGMFSDSYLPRVSGVVHSLAAFVTALRRMRHQVTVVAPAYPGAAETDPDVIRFPSIRPPQQRDFPLAIPFAPSGWKRLRAIELDVVHAHSPFLLGAVAARVARQRRVPLVFTHHTLYDEYVHYVPWIGAGLTRPAVLRYVTAYANRCDCVIAPSRAVAARLRAQGVRSRVEVLATGSVDADLAGSPDPSWVREAFEIPRDRPLLVTVSRLGKEKSVDLLLEAFARVVGHTDAVLLVVGGGPEAPALRALAVRLRIDAQTIFAGPQPHRKTLECLAASDVFVFASSTETQGVAVIEAMAAGLPVVAVDAGGVTDAVRPGETGFLVPPSADALAERVLAVLDDRALRESLGRQGREAARQFSIQVLSQQLADLYQSLIPVHRP